MISVFSYPEHSKRCAHATGSINELLKILDSKYGISLPAEVTDGNKVHPSFSKFLIKFLDTCKKTHNHIDINWLISFNWVIKLFANNEPNKDTLSVIKPIISSISPDFSFLEPFLLEAKDNS